jgi:YHS domain-containing protein
MALAKRSLGLVLTVSLLSLLLVAAVPNERVKQVIPNRVCMINKTLFKTTQTPVIVDGRTYYVCCDPCKAQLLEDPSARVDVDPVSGNKVDKASAFVGVDKAGNVYFFENSKNLHQFRVPPKS